MSRRRESDWCDWLHMDEDGSEDMAEFVKTFWVRCTFCDFCTSGILVWTGNGLETNINFNQSPLARAAREHHDSLSGQNHNGYRLYLSEEDAQSKNYVVGNLAVSSDAFIALIDKEIL
jgi:hypothetical protein